MRSGTRYALAAVGVVSILAGPSAAMAGVIHVDRDAPGGGDGASWETAFNDLDAGLAVAGLGDEVWVAAGVYVGTFRLPNGVELYGGFDGEETSRSQRDWIANETILSGDRDGDDGPDFENYDDNYGPVVRADNVGPGTRLDGFTVTGGRSNAAGGGLRAEEGDIALGNCVFRRNFAEISGGGVHVWMSGALTADACTFVENRAGARGGGLDTSLVALVTVTRCDFVGNDAEVGAGGAGCFDSISIAFTGCTFRDNISSPAGIGTGAGLVVGFCDVGTVTDCVFAANKAGFGGGAIGSGATNGTFVNCVFSRNEGGHGAGMLVSSETCTVINSTFGANAGSAIESSTPIEIVNSIIWASSGPPFEGGGVVSVSYSDVEGGWPGVGNIDQDPLFVQPGTDDLRLALGSPCVDAGNNDAVPEGIEFDVDGNPRIQNGTVDMGAYEGEHDAQPGRAENEDVDDGETVLLVPNGGGLDPEANTLVVFTNRSGEDDASASLTEYEQDRHPAARGFSSLGTTAVLETSLEDGDFLAAVFIPFGEEDLGGVDPFALDLTYYDKSVGNWALAVGRNTARSPGHRGVFGDRITREGPGSWGVTLEVGDYGVFFNTETRRGFVWANVDHAADFSSGVALCPADAWQPPDSNVDFDDILAVIDNWGEGPGPYDVDGDGVVDADDLFAVLGAWGGCE